MTLMDPSWCISSDGVDHSEEALCDTHYHITPFDVGKILLQEDGDGIPTVCKLSILSLDSELNLPWVDSFLNM